MKFAVYEVRPDETQDIARVQQALGVELVCTPETCTAETLALAAGCDGISTCGYSALDAALLAKIKAQGIRAVTTRTVGTNHIDLTAAHALGLAVGNANYGPESVADYTVMLLLMLLRNYKPAMWLQQVNDFSLPGLIGRQLRHLTVGVVGTGRIGCQVMQDLSGFGCRFIAADPHPNEKAAQYATYMPLEQLWQEADCITLHAPLLESTYHMVDRKALSMMKDGVVLINCARGPLMDMEAVTEAVESGKIGRLGLDVFENEEGIYHENHKYDDLKNREMAYLRQFRNVVLTQHMAFYTEEAVAEMVELGLRGLVGLLDGSQTSL